MFKNNEEALAYLRKCGKVFIPSKFTYWCHSGQVKTNSDLTANPKFDKLWSEIPSDSFIVRGELSLLSKRQRLQYVGQHQSFEAAPTSYATVEGQEGFQIKVVVPKTQLSKQEFAELGKDEAYKRKLAFEDRGLGDGRHPKLSGKTKVLMFGFMNQDEMSGKQIKTVVGVREEDLIAYASEVQSEIREKAKFGIIENSEYAMPKSREDIVEEKELFVMGDNEYKEFAGIHYKKSENNSQENKSSNFFYDLKKLKGIIEEEYSGWKDTGDPVSDRYKTIQQARQDRLKQNPTVAGVYGVSAKNGNVFVDRCENSVSQKRLLESMHRKAQELSQSVEGHIESKYGNYLAYATNGYCDLEAITQMLPQVEERLDDLVAYEKYVGKFSTLTVETQTVKKAGIRGFFGAKETQFSQRRLTNEELLSKKESDIVKLNIALAEGQIDKAEYDKTCESIERLYGSELQVKSVERVSADKLEEMKLEFQPKKSAINCVTQQNKIVTQQKALDESSM